MKKFKRIAGIIALVAVMALAFASCDSPEEKAAKAAALAAEQAAKAAEEAAGNLLTVLGGTDAAAIAEALQAAGPAAFTALTVSSASPGGDFLYSRTEVGGVTGIWITGYTGNGGTVIVPAEIEGYPVVILGGFNGTYIDPSGYGSVVESNGGEFITAVILPDTIKTIAPNAFEACENLHTINIPAEIAVIGDHAFMGCEDLYNLTIPDSITTISFDNYVNDTVRDGLEVEIFATFSGCGKLPLATRDRLWQLGYKGTF